MRRTGGMVLGLALLAATPVAAQEAEEREAVRQLLALMADARSGDTWTAALQPHPVVRLDSLLRRHGLDLRAQDPRRPPAGTSAPPGREHTALTAERDPPPLLETVRLQELVRRLERDIERWILRGGSGADGGPVATSTASPASPPPGTDATSAEPPGGGRPR